MPYRYIPGQAPDPYDPLNSRDIRIGVKPAEGMAIDTGRIGDIGKELAYTQSRDSGQFGGSPDLVSFAATAPLRGVGLAAEGAAGAIGGLSEFLNSIGPVKAYGETIGKPIGDIGGTVLDWIGGPGRFIQDIAADLRLNNLNDLPTDVQQVFNSQGRDAAIQYMREQGISFTNDKTLSLAASLILDPLNLTPFVFGKVALLPNVLKVAGVGLGATAGAAAGGVGLAAGGISGYKLAGNVVSKLPDVLKTRVGYDLSGRIMKVRAQLETGEKVTEAAWIKSVADIQDGMFGLTKGIGATVKAAFAIKAHDVGLFAFGDDMFDWNDRAASVFDGGTNAINVRRYGQATQAAALSTARDMALKNLNDTNSTRTELLVADYISAARLKRADNLEDSIESIMISNLPEGVSAESRYGVSSLGLSAEVDQLGRAIGTRTRGISMQGSNYPQIQIWKSKRIASMGAKDLERGAVARINLEKEAELLLKHHDEIFMSNMTELLIGQVTREAAITGALDFQDIIVGRIGDYADTLASAAKSDLARSAGPIKATPDQLAHVIREVTDGGRVVDGKIVGGRFFDETGQFTGDAKKARAFTQRLASVRHIQYGHTVNRVGNIRRIITLAEGFDELPAARQKVIVKEISKGLGRPVTAEEVSRLSKMGGERAGRLTILRDDGLIDTEVVAYQKAYGLIQKADLTADELVEVGLRQDLAEELAAITSDGAEGVARAISRRQVAWARAAARQFEDVRNMETRGLGRADHRTIKEVFDEAVRNDAMHSAASAQDLDRLRQLWTMTGGNLDEIEDLIRSTERNGYRLGIAPEDGLLTVPMRMVVSEGGVPKTIIVKTLQPYADVTSDFVDGFKGLAKRPRVGYFNGILKRMFAPVAQSRIQGAARQRLMTSLAPWMTPDEIVQFDSEINDIASQQRLGVRGLVSATGSDSQITKAADDVIKRLSGDSLRDRIVEARNAGVPSGLDIDTVVLKAYAGDASVSGVTQWITGQIKARGIPGIGMGKGIAVLTERFYPTLKYSVNPVFWIQEIIESPFFAEGRGIRTQEVLASLEKAGFTPQEVRALLGERTSSIAKNLNEAAFGTTIATRGGIPSTLDDAAELTSAKSVWQKLRAKFGDRIDTIAEFKEGYRDIMVLSEYSKRWVKDIAKARPHEYLALRAQFGDDASELDLLLGHLNEYRRAQDIAWGDDAFDHSKPDGYAFAVSPSVDGLARVQERAAGFEEFALSEDGLRALYNNRPSDVFRPTRLKIVQEARLSGFSVGVLQQRYNQMERTAARLRNKMLEDGYASINGSDELAEYQSAVASFREEGVVGVGRQSSMAGTHEMIIEELYKTFLPQSAAAPSFRQVMTALANGRRYGAEFGPINNVLFEVYERAGGDSLLNLTQQERVARIRKSIDDVISPNVVGEAPVGETILQNSTSRVAKILSSSAMRMIEKHGPQEALMRASKYRYQEMARQLDKVNYFNPDRSLIERTMNHQFLGLYPLSYMFGKVLPEITRFMFWKPFGAIAPGAGYQAYNKIVEYMGREGLSPDFEARGIERPDYMFFLAQLLPGHPDDISVGVPGWLRRSISTVSRQGYDQLTADKLFGEVGAPLVDTGVLGGARTFIKSLQELTSGPTDDEQLSETVNLRR